MITWTVKNKENMNDVLLVVPPQKYNEKYEVINKRMYNHIRILQIGIGATGGLSIAMIAFLTKNLLSGGYICLILLCINLVLIFKRNKYERKIY